MKSDNSGIKYVTKIDYLGPHQITTTGSESFSINVKNINPRLFTITKNSTVDCDSETKKRETETE